MRAVSAKGDRLALELSAPNDPTSKGDTLVVLRADGLELAGRGFRIRTATRIEWGESGFEPQVGKPFALEAH